MNIRMIFAIGESILAYFLVSLGSVLQKKGIGWLGHKGDRDAGFFRNRLAWITGFILINLAQVPNFLALRAVNSYVVNAISGLNIVFMVFLSRLILREKVLRSDYLYSAVIFGAIVAANLVDKGVAARSVSFFYALLFGLGPVVLFAGYILFGRHRRNGSGDRVGAIVYAAIGGGLGGLVVTFLKILQMVRVPRLTGYLLSPYLYTFLVVTTLSFVSMQVAYKKGDMVVVGPVQFSTMVFYPILAAFPIFSLPVNVVQLAFFAAIVLAVVQMVRRHGRAGKEVRT